MMHVLAQGGGGGGGWLNPATVKIGLYVIFGLFVLLGGIFKKISEQKAKREAERARERRRDDMLRTGRDESGAFVDVSRIPAEALDPPTAAMAATNEDARRRLKELAERRRQELSNMAQRAAQAGSVSGGGAPRAGTRTPVRLVAPLAQSEQLQPGVRRNAEPDRRAQRGKQAKKGKSAQQPQRETEREGPAYSAIPTAPAGHTNAPVHSAYILPQDRTSSALSEAQLTATEKISAAMKRIGGNSGTADWRRAIVLGELVGRPVSMRGPDQG